MNKTDKEKTLLDAIESEIEKTNLSEAQKTRLYAIFLRLRKQELNIMITGATGAGKSSTINALFNAEKAKIGMDSDPETMEIARYEMDHMVIWDTPGLGDGKEADARHAKAIIKKLNERDNIGNRLIDLILVVLDGSTHDLYTSYELINQVIIPNFNFGEDREGRILVAINQADVAMKGKYWNYEENKPEPELVKFLEAKVESVRKRIKDATGVNITPIYYSAGFKEDGQPQCLPYNLAKLIYYIVSHTPKRKRLAVIDNMNRDQFVWVHNESNKGDSSDHPTSSANKYIVEIIKEMSPELVDIFLWELERENRLNSFKAVGAVGVVITFTVTVAEAVRRAWKRLFG